MDAALKMIIPLLYALSKGSAFGVKKSDLLRALAMESSQLAEVVSAINSYQDLVADEGESLRLKDAIDFLDSEYIHKISSGEGRVEVLNEVDSTNSEMIRRADNLVSGDVIVAELQSAGRGRADRRWHGGIGSQITFSVCHKFAPGANLHGLSVAVGSAVVTELERLGGCALQLKWPNDLFCKGKKCGGILVENVLHGHDAMAVVGLGLNLSLTPAHLEDLAAGPLKFTGKVPSRTQLCTKLISALRKCCHDFEAYGLHPFSFDIARQNMLLNQEVRLELPSGEIVAGVVQGIGPHGELLVDDEGKLVTVTSGHVLEIMHHAAKS